eukprot:jgi/Chrpa1/6515/Chrysochromulina_OHIO_Genome00012950-RA
MHLPSGRQSSLGRAATPSSYSELLALCSAAAPRLLVITGAGLSTESGIPDYRSPAGSYSRGHKPVQHDEFVGSESRRKHYWSRSLRGWTPFASAQPNSGHDALARLDQAQRLLHIITQNVDGLHQQAELALLPEDEGAFRVPPCGACGGVLKTDVTFFGDSLPSSFKARTLELAREADGVLVAGTSLMVLSAFRLVEAAAAKGAPIAVVNLGQTRLEKEGVPHLKVEAPCGATLSRLADDLLAERAA